MNFVGTTKVPVETVIMMTYCGDKGNSGCITTRYCGLKLKK